MDDMSFWASWFVWRDAMAAAVLSAALLSLLGVWVVLKRVVYVPLALSQVSSLGVVVAFLLGDLFAESATEAFGILDPGGMSYVFAGLAALYFARSNRRGQDGTAVAYLLAAAGVLLLCGFIRHDLHDIQSVLFGNAVLVETRQVLILASVAAAILLLHALFFRRLLFASFDREAAGAGGLRTALLDALLFLMLAVSIAAATRAIGALPSFAFCVLPPMAALRVGRSMRSAMGLSVVIGVLSASFGYYLSFVFEWPTGATMVALCGAALVACHLAARLRKE